MIPFTSFLGFKKVNKEAWFESKKKELENEFRVSLSEIQKRHDSIISENRKILDSVEEFQRNLKTSQLDVEDLLKRTQDKKLELEKKNVELSQQIRLIEAKASPDQVWTTAFSLGFSKAWDMMKPMIYDGFDKVKKEISDNAKMETLNGLQSVLRGKNGIDSEKN